MNHISKSYAAEIVGDQLLDRRAVAEIFGVSPNSINISQWRGTFPVKPIRIGHRLRWKASDIRAFLATGGDGQAATTGDKAAR